MNPKLLLAAMFLAYAGHLLAQEQSESPKKPAVRISYLANAGVMVNTADETVLIDALFRDAVGDFAKIDPGTLSHMETGGKPFNETKLVLVTSPAPDHFDAESVGRFLLHNRGATLVSAPQVVAAVKEKSTDLPATERRVRSWTQASDPAELDVNGIKVRPIKLTHDSDAASAVEEYGYVVEFAGKRFVHVGHAKFDEQAKAGLLAAAAGVDAAIVPYWWAQNEAAREFLSGPLAAKTILAIHIPPAQAESIEAEMKTYSVKVAPLIRPLGSRRL